MVNLEKEQVMTGVIEGENVIAKPEKGGEEIVGHIIEIDRSGRAHIIEWTNGVILAREPFQHGRTEPRHDESQYEEKSPSRRLESPLESSGISIAGRWSSTIGRIYEIDQDGPHFDWRVEGLDELGEGRIEESICWQNGTVVPVYSQQMVRLLNLLRKTRQ